ncbi:MAG TPA: hypothetical protein VKT77_13925 [Chthonomonadaceae bacterium]|nr:hypothetical protein [Chthonomonadaceae bacterium]
MTPSELARTTPWSADRAAASMPARQWPILLAASARRRAVGIAAALVTLFAGASATAAGGPDKHGVPAPAPTKSIATPLRLAYGYKTGDVRRYHVVGYFNGHFPPFVTEGSEAVHLMIQLDYAATVKKESDKGADVEFNVEQAALAVLRAEPPEGVTLKMDDKDVAELPVPLEQVQKMFNATATFKPTGEIASIRGGDSSSMKLDIGIDLRKLFLVTAPITLSDKPVKTGDQWPFTDGLLGSKPGKTTYTGRLQSIAGNAKSVQAVVWQQADSTVDSQLDKEGNSTTDAKAAVGTLVGNVSLKGTEQFAAGADGAAPSGSATGRATGAKLTMVASLKRTLPDPDKPGTQVVTDIDIKARLYVSPAAKPAPAKTATDAGHTGGGKRAATKAAAAKG